MVSKFSEKWPIVTSSAKTTQRRYVWDIAGGVKSGEISSTTAKHFCPRLAHGSAEEFWTIRIAAVLFPLFQKYLCVYYESNALFLTPTPYLSRYDWTWPMCYYAPQLEDRNLPVSGIYVNYTVFFVYREADRLFDALIRLIIFPGLLIWMKMNI